MDNAYNQLCTLIGWEGMASRNFRYFKTLKGKREEKGKKTLDKGYVVYSRDILCIKKKNSRDILGLDFVSRIMSYAWTLVNMQPGVIAVEVKL